LVVTLTRLFLSVFIFSFLSSCSGLFYFPSKQKYYDPKQFSLEYEDLWIESSEGIKLNAWHVRNPKAQDYKGLILLFHGNAENISSHFLNLAWITEYGFELFIVDYRGYGRSEGEPDQMGTHQDALHSLYFALKRAEQKKNSKFIVYCQSLGGAICARALVDFEHSSSIDLLVLDSSFSSYKDLAYQKLKDHWLTYLLSPLAEFIISDKMASKPHLNKLSMKKLVYHSKGDLVIPYKFGEEIFGLLSEPKTFIGLETEGHIQVFKEKSRRDEFLKIINEL
jgi:predicted alpha/beta-fold hydrolase